MIQPATTGMFTCVKASTQAPHQYYDDAHTMSRLRPKNPLRNVLDTAPLLSKLLQFV